ncbi:MAG: sigma-70 family RNA polymerase sigma factor [Treponema sp.]|uniref:sigma-70 family RNA polymerase sigma factor n=1 Tax=Treponema sp. TaxID=166 RepID=UPI00298D793E|nr:sigma-70 family RNA polymerase sigma factor [Treponema sp.]MCQ2600902.1 sigma-70 family RNA polymerase sigma factor [Treponema sp.]
MKTFDNNFLGHFASEEFIPSEKINSVILEAQKGDQSSFNRIVSSCQYLVLNVARNSGVLSYSTGYEDDVISSGNIGLLNAIRNFNVSKGKPFIPYARLCIRGSIFDFLNSNNQIHYSKKVIQYLNKLSKKEGKEELSEVAYKVIPLFSINLNGEEVNICDLEGICNNETPEVQYMNKEQKEIIFQFLAKLPDRERFIITRYFGINCNSLSYSEIGKILNISKQQLCKILHRALNN